MQNSDKFRLKWRSWYHKLWKKLRFHHLMFFFSISLFLPTSIMRLTIPMHNWWFIGLARVPMSWFAWHVIHRWDQMTILTQPPPHHQQVSLLSTEKFIIPQGNCESLILSFLQFSFRTTMVTRSPIRPKCSSSTSPTQSSIRRWMSLWRIRSLIP